MGANKRTATLKEVDQEMSTYRVVRLTETLGLERLLKDLLIDSRGVLDGDSLGVLELVKLDVGMRESAGDMEGSLRQERKKRGRRRLEDERK